MKHAVLNGTSRWVACLLALVLAGASRQAAAQAPAQPVLAATTTQPVQAPVHGQLTDIFFAAGDWVKRGQILAKLMRSDGSPAYLLAPAPGRIGPARQQMGERLAAHATLAVIETVPGR